jgi:hypothetical protein
MSDFARLPVWPTVLTAWRQFAARPDYVLRVGWIPALLIFSAGALLRASTGGAPGASFLKVGFALLNFAVLVQALVAWQRYALPGTHPRRGLTGLRGGRAEFFTLLHFPLVGVLFVPLLTPAILESLALAPESPDGLSNGVLALSGLFLLVFPGGLVLVRAALMLPAIAVAGKKQISLPATANRVWTVGAGNSVRLLAVFYLTVLPAVLAIALLPAGIPQTLYAAAIAVLLPLYIMLCGGAVAVAYGRLAASNAKTRLIAS